MCSLVLRNSKKRKERKEFVQISILKIEIFLYLGVNFVGNKSALDFVEI